MKRTVDLIQYLPNVLRDVREFKEITNTENPEFNLSWKSIQDVFDDQFIMQSTVNGVKRWEKILGIYPKESDTLEIRKFRILALLNRHLPYTHRTLIQMLNTMFGEGNFEVILNYNEYELSIEFKVAPLDWKVYQDTMRDVIPCNLIFETYFKFSETDIEVDIKQTHSIIPLPICGRAKCGYRVGKGIYVDIDISTESAFVSIPLPICGRTKAGGIYGS
ncbi:MAG: DUF2313 domain-containing protein [Bacillales bacterium]|nr:DUF2313 domain-containing protein [Bacillales bacterium]